jgi:hypothetical protein
MIQIVCDVALLVLRTGKIGYAAMSGPFCEVGG